MLAQLSATVGLIVWYVEKARAFFPPPGVLLSNYLKS
jgi:hypothetical protein